MIQLFSIIKVNIRLSKDVDIFKDCVIIKYKRNIILCVGGK